MELILENVRCFAGRHVIPTKPLTFLVGENSSGKTTFLAGLASVGDRYAFPFRTRFNESPYSLGIFDTIASYTGGSKTERAHSFSFGYRVNTTRAARKRTHATTTEFVATFTSELGLPVPSKLCASDGRRSVEAQFVLVDGMPRLDVFITQDGSTRQIPTSLPQGIKFSPEMRHSDAFDRLLFVSLIRGGEARSAEDNETLEFAEYVFHENRLESRKTHSIAPIRTKPKRTYDQSDDEFSPEGDHVPFVLSTVIDNKANKDVIERFGEESGLFRHVYVKKLGKNVSDPRQVMVDIAGKRVNLVDVGYGVSQVLPVIVMGILAAPDGLLLLQQPEVHVHPRAQAALGSLLVNLMHRSNKQFIVETHSDYIIDRVRQEIAGGSIAADDVGILYFERLGGCTKVWPISLDKSGNIMDAPPSYRSFFLREELNLLRRTER